MKANELMIGDWVLAYGKKTQIVWVGNIHKMAVRGFPYEFMDREIEPIPITQEILEKNGFVVESRDCYGQPLQYCELVDGLWIDITGENYFEGKLECIHQLQHALRLCGIEKEIIL